MTMPRNLVQNRDPEVTARIARTNRWPILVLDWPATRLITVHVIFDPDGRAIGQFKTISAAFGYLIDHGHRTVILDSITWPRPFYLSIRREVKPTPSKDDRGAATIEAPEASIQEQPQTFQEIDQ
jgi:hypothetical protein